LPREPAGCRSLAADLPVRADERLHSRSPLLTPVELLLGKDALGPIEPLAADVRDDTLLAAAPATDQEEHWHERQCISHVCYIANLRY